MKITDTISVNPSKTALGHVETSTSSIFRSQVLGVEKSTHSVNLLKILFPSCEAGMSEYRKYAVPLRTLFATILIVTGITLIETSVSIGFAICSLCFGTLLALGLFTRPLMLGAAVYYCILGAISLRTGTPDLSLFSLMFGCLIFAIIGSGKYSCDTFIRHNILLHRRNNERKRKEMRMSYKAFHTL